MFQTALSCSAALIAFFAVGSAAPAQAEESAIPNLMSADFGWQPASGLNFLRVEGKVAPVGRGPFLEGIERLSDADNPNLTPWAADRMRLHNQLGKNRHPHFYPQSRCVPGGVPRRLRFH